jgi:hypothetical protein
VKHRLRTKPTNMVYVRRLNTSTSTSVLYDSGQYSSQLMSSNNLGGLVSSPRLAWIYYTPTIHLNVTLSLVRIRELFTDRLLENNIISCKEQQAVVFGNSRPATSSRHSFNHVAPFQFNSLLVGFALNCIRLLTMRHPRPRLSSTFRTRRRSGLPKHY